MIEQRTPEWLAARCGRITGSNASKIVHRLKNGDYSSDRQSYMIQLLAERMTGSVSDNWVGKAAQRGVEMEPVAIAAYETETGSFVESGYWVDVGFWGCTPDAFVEEDGILSIKCPNTTTIVKQRFFETDIQPDYYWQVVAEMAATGRKWADIAVYDDRFARPEDRLWIRRVERGEDEIARLLSEFEMFNRELDELCAGIGLQWTRQRALPASVAEPLLETEALLDLERYLRG